MDTKANSKDTIADHRRWIIDSLGLEYSAEFVPFSQSRNAKEKNRSLNWRVTFKRGRQSLTTDYSQGVGHIPGYSTQPYRNNGWYYDYAKSVAESGKVRIDVRYETRLAGGVSLPIPSREDVLYSLVMEAGVLDFPKFEDWAADFGYDPDSRKGEAVYRACIVIALELRSMIGDVNLAKLRELFQDY